jgi:hypothetical protein
MKVKDKLTHITTFGGVKRLPLPEYCPTPDEYLTRCGNQSQLLGFATSHHTFVESPQRVIATHSTKSSHIQEVSYLCVTLTGDSCSSADACATLIRFGIQTEECCDSFGCSLEISQFAESVHGYQKHGSQFVSHSRDCLQIPELVFEMGMLLQMLLDSFLQCCYLLLQMSYVLPKILNGNMVAIHLILLGFQTILLLCQHPLQVFQSVKHGFQLGDFWWQRLPGKWVLHSAIVCQHEGIYSVSLCSSASSFDPVSHMLGIGKTHIPSQFIGKMSESLLISASGFQHYEDTGGISCQFLYFLDNSPEATCAVRELAQEDRFALWMVLPAGNIQVFLANVYTNNEFLNALHEMSPHIALGLPNNLVYGFVNSSSFMTLTLYSLRSPRKADLSTSKLKGFGAIDSRSYRTESIAQFRLPCNGAKLYYVRSGMTYLQDRLLAWGRHQSLPLPYI